MELRSVADLRPGMHFIWADDHTRDYMCSDSQHELNQVLKCVHVSRPDQDGEGKIQFTLLDDHKDVLWYDRKSVAIVVADGYKIVNHSVRCQNCGNRYGSHYGDPRIDGIRCDNHSSNWFVPREDDLWSLHRKLMKSFYGSHNDFFADLGL